MCLLQFSFSRYLYLVIARNGPGSVLIASEAEGTLKGLSCGAKDININMIQV